MTVPPIISGLGKATNFKFGRSIQSVHRNKSPLKIWENRERASVGESRDSRNFRSTPIISGMGEATNFKFRRYIQRVHTNESRLKMWENWSVGVYRDCPNFLSTPIISGTDKATNFKFGRYIHRVHPNKSPLKI